MATVLAIVHLFRHKNHLSLKFKQLYEICRIWVLQGKELPGGKDPGSVFKPSQTGLQGEDLGGAFKPSQTRLQGEDLGGGACKPSQTGLQGEDPGGVLSGQV